MPCASHPYQGGCSLFIFLDKQRPGSELLSSLVSAPQALAEIYVFSENNELPHKQDNLAFPRFINFCPHAFQDRLALTTLAKSDFIWICDASCLPDLHKLDLLLAAQGHYQAVLTQNGGILAGNPDYPSINYARDYACDSGSGWLFFPTHWLPKILAGHKHGARADLPLISPALADERRISILNRPDEDQEYSPIRQEIEIRIPPNHSEPARALLSIHGQTYDHYHCVISKAQDKASISALLHKLDPGQSKFRFDDAIPASGTADIVIELGEDQWLAHPDVLKQINRNLALCDELSCCAASISRPCGCGLAKAAHPVSASLRSFSPDLAFIDKKPQAAATAEINAPLPLELSPMRPSDAKVALSTVITPDFLPDALLSLGSYMRNCAIPCDPHIFIATEAPAEKAAIHELFRHSPFKIIFPDEMRQEKVLAKAMARRYGLGSNQYRWGMKAILLSELLQGGYDHALHLDPDIYAVSDITDIQARINSHELTLFPHFRNPDDEASRKFLYQDGFFNGGMLGASGRSLPHLRKLTERCLREMRRDRLQNLFDDQKYYELFILEAGDVYVNKDKGINYSIWNTEPVEGLLGPSQRSYLLKAGAFTRIWHMHSDFLKTLATGHPAYAHTPPFIILYHLARTFAGLFLALCQPESLCLFEKRLLDTLDKLSGWVEAGAIARYKEILAALQSGAKTSQLLDGLVELTLASASFDNFELYARFLRWLLPQSRQRDNLIAAFRANDFRYISESGGQAVSQDMEAIQRLQAERAARIYDWLQRR